MAVGTMSFGRSLKQSLREKTVSPAHPPMTDNPKGPGQPTKYKPGFCATVIEVGSAGGWLCEMAEACDVHRNTMDNWAEAHPEFLEALSRAKQKSQAWFEKVGREGMTADKFNSALWQKQMSARHPAEYTERRVNEVTGKDGGPVTFRSANDLTDDQLAAIATSGGATSSGEA